MEKKNQAGNSLPMQVTDKVSVVIIPDSTHEFLMDTANVAYGYGTSTANIREHKRINDEFIEGKHFIVGVRIPDSEKRFAHNKIFWTKRGIVRLGFFIKSERARMFRDWAEELVLRIEQQRDLFGQPLPEQRSVSKGALPAKRNHNRLSPDRLLSIMADVCQIEDKQLRLSISRKLMQGGLA